MLSVKKKNIVVFVGRPSYLSTGIITLFPYSLSSPGCNSGDGCESKDFWRGQSCEFDFSGKICAMEKPHTFSQKKRPSGSKPGLDRGDHTNLIASDAWSGNVHLSYTSPTSTALFCRFGRRVGVELWLFRKWGIRWLDTFGLVPSRSYRHEWPYRNIFQIKCGMLFCLSKSKTYSWFSHSTPTSDNVCTLLFSTFPVAYWIEALTISHIFT